MGRSLRAHVREEDDISDGGRVREEHHDAIDTYAETGRGRHAVLERADVIGVVHHRLLVALRPPPPASHQTHPTNTTPPPPAHPPTNLRPQPHHPPHPTNPPPPPTH